MKNFDYYVNFIRALPEGKNLKDYDVVNELFDFQDNNPEEYLNFHNSFMPDYFNEELCNFYTRAFNFSVSLKVKHQNSSFYMLSNYPGNIPKIIKAIRVYQSSFDDSPHLHHLVFDDFEVMTEFKNFSVKLMEGFHTPPKLFSPDLDKFYTIEDSNLVQPYEDIQYGRVGMNFLFSEATLYYSDKPRHPEAYKFMIGGMINNFYSYTPTSLDVNSFKLNKGVLISAIPPYITLDFDVRRSTVYLRGELGTLNINLYDYKHSIYSSNKLETFRSLVRQIEAAKVTSLKPEHWPSNVITNMKKLIF